MIHGRDIKIFNSSGTALIACAKSCTIHKQCEVIERTSATNLTSKEYIPGRTSWSIDLAYLVSTGTEGIPLVGTTYNITVMVGSSQALTGKVICTLCDIQATVGNLATGSIKMQGTGPLTPQ
jgi:hypothetical protein